jgi:hypothetical protein
LYCNTNDPFKTQVSRKERKGAKNAAIAARCARCEQLQYKQQKPVSCLCNFLSQMYNLLLFVKTFCRYAGSVFFWAKLPIDFIGYFDLRQHIKQCKPDV